MTHHTPEGLPPLPELPRPDLGLPWRMNDADGNILSSAFTPRQMHAYAIAYAREALRAQAASPADMEVYQGIADRYQRDVQAAGAEPAAVMLQQAYRLGFLRCTAWAGRDDLEHDVGSPAYLKDQANDLMPITTKLYASAPPAHVAADVGARSAWFALAMNAAAYLEDAAACLRDKDAKAAALGAAKHVRKECNAMWFTQHPTPSPATAVDAVEVMTLADRYRNAEGGKDAADKRENLRAALQASRQPQAQQGGGEAAGESDLWQLLDAVTDEFVRRGEHAHMHTAFGVGSKFITARRVKLIAELDAALATKEQRS